MNLTSPHINLKGFIVANGATDYNTDPYISTIEIANAFDLIPNAFFKKYQEAGCRLYLQNMKVNDPEPCPEMFKWLGQRNKEANIYQLRIPNIMEINGTNEGLSSMKEQLKMPFPQKEPNLNQTTMNLL
jgi:hypothetical protein